MVCGERMQSGSAPEISAELADELFYRKGQGGTLETSHTLAQEPAGVVLRFLFLVGEGPFLYILG